MTDETTDDIGPLGQAIAWLVLAKLAEDVGEQRMTELIGEAVGIVVAAEHGDEDAQARVLHAAAGFATAVKGRRALTERLAARSLN